MSPTNGVYCDGGSCEHIIADFENIADNGNMIVKSAENIGIFAYLSNSNGLPVGNDITNLWPLTVSTEYIVQATVVNNYGIITRPKNFNCTIQTEALDDCTLTLNNTNKYIGSFNITVKMDSLQTDIPVTINTPENITVTAKKTTLRKLVGCDGYEKTRLAAYVHTDTDTYDVTPLVTFESMNSTIAYIEDHNVLIGNVDGVVIINATTNILRSSLSVNVTDSLVVAPKLVGYAITDVQTDVTIDQDVTVSGTVSQDLKFGDDVAYINAYIDYDGEKFRVDNSKLTVNNKLDNFDATNETVTVVRHGSFCSSEAFTLMFGDESTCRLNTSVALAILTPPDIELKLYVDFEEIKNDTTLDVIPVNSVLNVPEYKVVQLRISYTDENDKKQTEDVNFDMYHKCDVEMINDDGNRKELGLNQDTACKLELKTTHYGIIVLTLIPQIITAWYTKFRDENNKILYENQLELYKVQCTDKYHQIIVDSVVAQVNNPLSATHADVSLSARSANVFSNTLDIKYDHQYYYVSASSPGAHNFTVSLNNENKTYSVDVKNETEKAINITWNPDSDSEKVKVIFPSATVSLPSTSWDMASIVTFQSYNDDAISIDNNGVLTHHKNTKEEIQLMAHLTCDMSISTTISRYGNVVPKEYEIDLGYQNGKQFQVNDQSELEVEVWIKLGQNDELRNIQLVMTYDAANLLYKQNDVCTGCISEYGYDVEAELNGHKNEIIIFGIEDNKNINYQMGKVKIYTLKFDVINATAMSLFEFVDGQKTVTVRPNKKIELNFTADRDGMFSDQNVNSAGRRLESSTSCDSKL